MITYNYAHLAFVRFEHYKSRVSDVVFNLSHRLLSELEIEVQGMRGSRVRLGQV